MNITLPLKCKILCHDTYFVIHSSDIFRILKPVSLVVKNLQLPDCLRDNTNNAYKNIMI